VLFAGTERRCSSRTTAARTGRAAANLPTTRYDDIVVHPRTKDLVLGTHGRGIWILDDASPIAEWTPAIARSARTCSRAARDADALLGRRLEHDALLLHGGESGGGRGVHVSTGAARSPSVSCHRYGPAR
jgi:hypothetical protein